MEAIFAAGIQLPIMQAYGWGRGFTTSLAGGKLRPFCVCPLLFMQKKKYRPFFRRANVSPWPHLEEPLKILRVRKSSLELMEGTGIHQLKRIFCWMQSPSIRSTRCLGHTRPLNIHS